MRALNTPTFLICALVALSACAPSVPDSVRYDDAQRARDAALAGAGYTGPYSTSPPLQPAAVPSVEATPLGSAPLAGSAEETASEAARILAETRPQGVPPQPTGAPVANPGTPPNNPGLSRENDFEVVASRETIESDAARIAENRAQYVVVEPQALPDRPGETQPNIVDFALATSHPVGAALYARAGLGGEGRAARNCADYPSPDQAQIDFLARGGPERDRRGIDPDGDGYACSWDPTPFRKAAQG